MVNNFQQLRLIIMSYIICPSLNAAKQMGWVAPPSRHAICRTCRHPPGTRRRLPLSSSFPPPWRPGTRARSYRCAIAGTSRCAPHQGSRPRKTSGCLLCRRSRRDRLPWPERRVLYIGEKQVRPGGRRRTFEWHPPRDSVMAIWHIRKRSLPRLESV